MLCSVVEIFFTLKTEAAGFPKYRSIYAWLHGINAKRK